jgi:membrane fusion protein, multidrug efflux system
MKGMDSINQGKKNRKAYIPLIVILVILLVVGGVMYSKYMKYVTTDDALVDGNNVALSSKIMGRISKLYAEEGDSVKANQLLVILDTADFYTQKLLVESQVSLSMNVLEQAEIKYKADAETIKVAKINADKAQVDFERAQRQKDADVITEAQFEEFKKNADASRANLVALQSLLKASAAQVEVARASVESAKAGVDVASTQLQNSKLYSPFDGIIARRWLMPGDMAQPGQSIFTINSSKHIWVSVYIEETKLKYLHIGQDAEFTIDAIPNAVFTGKIYYIGNSTASKFSLIPPSNASGNFTKITQRVQLKVSIDGVKNGKISDYSIFPGMSVVMKLLK